MIEKKEIRYILWALGVAFVWMVLVIPNLDSLGISKDPLLRFLVFNIGIFVILQVLLKAIVLNRNTTFSESFGLMMIANGVDLLAPPFIWNTLGQANTSVLLSEASSDFIAGNLWQSLGIHGFILYCAVYVLTPILLFIGASFLIKNFVRKL